MLDELRPYVRDDVPVVGMEPMARGVLVAGRCRAWRSAGLEYTFLLFLGTLLAAGLLALAGLRTYPRDVATAAASAEAVRQSGRTAARKSGLRPDAEAEAASGVPAPLAGTGSSLGRASDAVFSVPEAGSGPSVSRKGRRR